jgi:tetratricopeptide (TPR) repeat protein
LLSKLENSAARLHREGAAQVVSYHGPIVDELSTRAEVALYAAIAEGETTAYAVRQARAALLRPLASSELTHPFAWAQLAYYQRGPDRPLSLPARPGQHRQMEAELQRTFQGMGNRRVLATGFIGRRTELHQVRRRIREGQRVLVFQGLGGLGKTTLAFHTLPLLSDAQNQCTLWCQEVEKEPDRAEGLVGQLLAYCRTRFGVDWEPVVQKVDRAAGNDPVQRFGYYLNSLLDRAPGFVLYFDNLESLLIGPKELAEGPADAGAFAQWHSAPVAGIWALARQTAEDSDRLYVVASCRYRHADFGRALLPVALLPADALYRLMGWFPALRRLASATRAELVQRLAGHPRAVEFANTLLDKALADWQESHGAWRLPAALTETDLKREWDLLVAPALPRVQDQLWANLLLSAIWERVLDEQARRMLYRMTLLRRPWDADLIPHLSDPEDLAAAAEATAARLRRTSLLEQVEVGLRCLYTLHPATAQFVVENFAKPRRSSWFRRFARWFQPAQKPAQATEADLRRETHLRIGAWLEGRARNSVDRDVPIEAAYHLFQAKEYQRAYVVLSAPTHEMLNSGQAREALHLLEPFLAESLRPALTRPSVMRLLGKIGQGYWELSEPQKATVLHDQRLLLARELGDVREEGAALGDLGIAYHHLGQVEKAIGYYEQSLVIARQLGDRGLEGTNLGNLGFAYHDLGQTEKAISFHDQALAIARQVGDRNGEGFALGNLGLAYRALGQVEKEISYHEQQLVIMRQISNRRGEAMALNNLGGAYVALGQVDKAIGCHEPQLVIVRQISSRHGEGNALGGLGVAYHALGQVDKAIGYYEQQLAIVREIGDRHHEANALGNLGRAYGQLGDEVKATGYAEQQLRIAREILDRFQERDALGQLGQYAIKTGDSKKAIAYFENAQRVAQETGDQIGVITSFGNLGSAYSGLGQMAKALDCYAKQGEIARAIGDRRGEADSLCDQGRVHWRLGDPTKDIGFYEQALAISREVVGHRRTEGAALCNMGIAYKDLRLIDKARPLLEQALRIGQELQDSEITRSASTNLERLAGIPAPR